MSSISKLPPELLQLVFEEPQNIYTRNQSLARCARVSKQWHALATPLLYREVYLSSFDPSKRPIIKVLQAQPAYCMMIKSLVLSIFRSSTSPSTTSEQATDLLLASSNLQSLNIQIGVHSLSDQLAAAILGLKRLTKFEIVAGLSFSRSKHTNLLNLVMRRCSGLQELCITFTTFRIGWKPSRSPNGLSVALPEQQKVDTFTEFANAVRNQGLEIRTVEYEQLYDGPIFQSMVDADIFGSCESLTYTTTNPPPLQNEVCIIANRFTSLRTLEVFFDLPPEDIPVVDEFVNLSRAISQTSLASHLQAYHSVFQFDGEDGRHIPMDDLFTLDKFPNLQFVSLSTRMPYSLNVVFEGVENPLANPHISEESEIYGDVSQIRAIFDALRDFSRPATTNRKATLDIELDDAAFTYSCTLSLSFESGLVVSTEDHYPAAGYEMWNWRRDLLDEGVSDLGSESSEDAASEADEDHVITKAGEGAGREV